MTETIVWRPADGDDLPEPGERVLLRIGLQNAFVGEGWMGRDDERWYRYQSLLPIEVMFGAKVTHWAKMPTGE